MASVEHGLGCGLNDAGGDFVFLPFLHGFEFHLALKGRSNIVEVGDARHDFGLVENQGATIGIRDQHFEIAD